MKVTTSLWGCIGCFSIIGCGSSGGAPAPTPSSHSSPPAAETDTTSAADDFVLPPVPDGYERIVAPIIKGVPPGGDVLQCQYVLAPFDRDMDVLDVRGYQSRGGHHSVAYAVKSDTPIGTSRDCTTEDNTNIGAFLGGVGGEAGGAAKLPDGVVFRMTKGSSIMLNTHFLNPSEDTIDGQTVLDIKFDEVDTSRKVASMFVNITTDFTVAPQSESTADTSCTMPRDLEFLSLANHMHTYGASSETDLVRAGDTTGEPIRVDQSWSDDMQFNPDFTNWTLAAPLEVKKGDVLKTHCDWQNSTTKAVTFPDEMCLSFGFFLSDRATSPICFSGNWVE